MRLTSRKILRTLSTAVALTFFFSSIGVYADTPSEVLPSGYTPGVGSTSYSVNGSTGTFVSSDPVTTGSWDSFSIGSQATFDAFINNVHLSKVSGAEPSQIFGMLNVHSGKFFLVNPNGIYFAPGSSVNASGLVASTLDIDEQDFVSGNYKFRQTGQDPAAIVNAGLMTIGQGGLALLGGAVQNLGVIEARESSVVMAGGKEMALSFDDRGMISVLVDRSVSSKVADIDKREIKDGVLNNGIIRAAGGKVFMTAEAVGGIFDSLVNQKGIIEANSFGSKNGSVELVSNQSAGVIKNSGMITAKGSVTANGGTVHIFGEKVGLFGGLVDVSGKNGGEVLIGGDIHGSGSFRNSDYVYMSGEAVVRADALNSGNGGKIVLWADKAAQVYGALSARGGDLGGDGGFIETSGKEYLDFDANIDTSALLGQTGIFLLDPSTLTITDAVSGGTQDANAADGSILSGDPTVGANTISWGKIDSLAATTNIVLEATGLVTVSNVTGAAGGNITSADLVKLDLTSGSLTLRSTGNNIVFSDPNDVIRTEGGAVNFQAGGAITGGGLDLTGAAGDKFGNISLQAAGGISVGSIKTGGGNLTVNADTNNNNPGTFTVSAAKNISTAGGALDITARDLAITGTINTGSGSTTIRQSGANTIGLGATAGAMTISGAELQNITTHNLTIGNAVNGNMTVNGITAANSANIGGSLTLNATGSARSVTFATGASSFKNLTVNAGNGIAINQNVTTTAGRIALNADSDASGTGNLSVATLMTLNSGGSSMSIIANDLALTGTGALNSGSGDMTLLVSDSGTIGLGATAGNYSISAAELQNITANNLTIGDNTNGNITVNNILAANTANLTGTLTLNASKSASAVSFATNASAFKTLNINSGNGVAVNKNLTTTGALTVNADTDANGAGDLTVANLTTINSGNNTLRVTANDINLNATGRLNSGSAATTLLVSDGGTIGIGSAAANFALSVAELQNITAGSIKIGDSSSGALSISSAIAPSGTNLLSLESGGTISQNSGATVSVQNLALRANGAITLSENNAVTNLAVSNTGGTTQYKDIDGLTVGSVDGINGINTGNQDITILSGNALNINQTVLGRNINFTASNGSMTLAQNIIATGAVSLSTPQGSITDANGASNNLTALSLTTSSKTGTELDTTVTDLTAVNTTSGSILLRELDGVNLLNAQNSNGNVSVSTQSGNLNVDTILALSGDVSLTASLGGIQDVNGISDNISAQTVSLSSFGAMGSKIDPLEINFTGSTLIAVNGGSGDIVLDLTSSNDMTITNAAIAGSGDIEIRLLTDQRSLTILGASAADGQVSISNITDLFINGPVTSQGIDSAITLAADSEKNGIGDLIFSGAGSAAASSGLVTLSGANIFPVLPVEEGAVISAVTSSDATTASEQLRAAPETSNTNSASPTNFSITETGIGDVLMIQPSARPVDGAVIVMPVIPQISGFEPKSLQPKQ